VATTREDAPGDVRIVAYLVPENGLGVDAGALRAHLRRSLPEHMVPAAFVPVAAIPQTPNGKLDYRSLPAPPKLQSGTSGGTAGPAGGLQRVVAGVWRDVLGVDRVGADDNFFDLGGNSLLLVRARARLQEVLGRPVPTLALFRCPTVRTLAEYLAEAGAPAEP